MQKQVDSIDQENGAVADSVAVLLAAAKALPTKDSIQGQLESAAAAQNRGYFLPDEDEQVRDVFVRYLAIRSSLLELIHTVSAGKFRSKKTTSLPCFLVAFAAACLLIRKAEFIVNLANKYPVVRQKLDEAEPRYGLEAKNFTAIYNSLTAPKHWWAFYDAVRDYHVQRDAILELKSDSRLGLVVELLLGEEDYFQNRRADFLKNRLGYRLHSFLRRNRSGFQKTMFQLFKWSGSTIAELKQPFVKIPGAGKRVTPDVRDRLEGFLQPGDILVTRHDDAMSNLFLPGFWPHAAFYIGRPDQRGALGVKHASPVGDTIRFLEAKKDGVKLRPPEDTLKVDAFTVLRPTISDLERGEAVTRSLTHAGKLYDFVFDFSAADRLACTELVYRSYHGVGDVQFELQERAGRYCLSAEDLVNQALGTGCFEAVLVYGARGNDWVEGAEAHELLKSSFASTF